MELFEQIGEALMTAGKDVSQKAKDVSELAKLKIDIKAKEDYVRRQFTTLGESYYTAHKDDTDSEEKEQFFLIKEAIEEIERMKGEVLKLQGAAQCPKCGAKMPEGATFCSSCGAKLDDIFEE